MLAVYLFCLVLGGGFLLVSLLGGGGDADVDLDASVDLGGLDAGGGLESGADVHGFDIGAGDAHAGAVHHDAAASRIFSLRTLVYAMFGFGATGATLTALSVGTLVAFVFALVGGTGAGILVASLFRWLATTASGDAPRDAGLVGLTGTVTLPLSPSVPGNVVVERGGRRVTLRALPQPGLPGDPQTWRSVVVVDIERGVARVAPLAPGELDLLPSSSDGA
jgi:hypothetical protein